jgi:hypothetical protein
MIKIPKTICECPINDQAELNQAVIIEPEQCILSNCTETQETVFVELPETLCPCVITEEIVTLRKSKIKTIITKTCYADFIKNITSTKFCGNGPKLLN